jgi:hypothetical protein
VGCDARSADVLESVLPGMRVIPLAATASSGRPAKQAAELDTADLKPGMPVGTAFVWGDLDFTGLGTLTYVEGDRVLAFGHPMMNLGDVALPLARGEIVHVLASQYHSFKLGQFDGLIGTMTQDRDTAIAGRVGVRPPAIPLHVEIHGRVSESYDVQVAVNRRFTPFLVAVSGSLLTGQMQGEDQDMTVDATTQISIKGRAKPMVLSNRYASRGEPVSNALALRVAALMDNPFKPMEIERLSLSMKISEGNPIAAVTAASLDAAYARPGQEVGVTVTFLPWHAQQTQVRRMRFTVPKDTQPGTDMYVLVCGGTQSEMIDLSMDPGVQQPRDIDQLIELLARSEPATNLVLRVSSISRGLSYRGEAMPELPPSVAGALAGDTQSGLVMPLVEDQVQRAGTDWVVTGNTRLRLRIAR